jgi:hypothetical protein
MFLDEFDHGQRIIEAVWMVTYARLVDHLEDSTEFPITFLGRCRILIGWNDIVGIAHDRDDRDMVFGQNFQCL